MGAARDIGISVAGAAVVGLIVYGVDKYLATKQTTQAATSSPDLSAGGFVQAEQLGAEFMGNGANSQLAGTPGNIATPPPGSTTTIVTAPNGNVTTTTAPTPSTNGVATPPPPSAAQTVIVNQQAELAQLLANAGNVNYNKPVTSTVQ